MTDDTPPRNGDDGEREEQTTDGSVRGSARTLAADADTTTTRRRVCQALSVLGTAHLAGCSSEDADLDPREESTESEPDEPTDNPDSAENVAELITAHEEQLADRSYTLAIELQGAQTDAEIVNEIEYLRSGGSDPLASLTERSTIDDGIDRLTHVFGPNRHDVDIEFADGNHNAANLGGSGSVIEITGGSVLDEYLLGAALSEPERREDDETGETLRVYEIDTHRSFDVNSGRVIVGPNKIVRAFDLEWRDAGGTGRWVSAETTAIGSTTVDLSSI